MCVREFTERSYIMYQFLLNEAFREILCLRNSRNIQRDLQYKSGLLNMIKEGIMNFKYFNFDIETYSFFRRFEVVVCKKIRQQTMAYYIYM